MEDTVGFLSNWYTSMSVAATMSVVLALIVFLVYKILVSTKTDSKKKYDYINANEIKWLKRVFLILGIAAAFAINLYGEDKYSGIGLWFFVRIFISVCAATLVAYVASLVLDYYYPTPLNFKLRKLRYTPRVNPKTGNKMRLLSEDEEDVHLDEGRQAEENIFSIDYDVWLDEETGDVKIEKYQGHLIALQCNNCGFYTMKVQMEEIAERNEDGSPKELLRHYKCSYCENVRATAFLVSRKEADDYKNQKPKTRGNVKSLEVIKLELVSTLGKRKSYEFSTVAEAQKFLAEFDFDKLA
ncbi:MAG: hypothetical protein ACKOC0_00520 [Cytophagales bacterium]